MPRCGWRRARCVPVSCRGVLGFAKLALACVAGLAAFFVLSNIGYYFGGGFSVSMGAPEFARRVSQYFPYYLTSTLIYSAAGVSLAAVVAYIGGYRGLRRADRSRPHLGPKFRRFRRSFPAALKRLRSIRHRGGYPPDAAMAGFPRGHGEVLCREL